MLAGQLLDVECNRLLTELRIDQIPCNTQNLRTGAATPAMEVNNS